LLGNLERAPFLFSDLNVAEQSHRNADVAGDTFPVFFTGEIDRHVISRDLNHLGSAANRGLYVKDGHVEREGVVFLFLLVERAGTSDRLGESDFLALRGFIELQKIHSILRGTCFRTAYIPHFTAELFADLWIFQSLGFVVEIAMGFTRLEPFAPLALSGVCAILFGFEFGAFTVVRVIIVDLATNLN